MLSGDNSILSRATQAKKETEKKGTYEQIQLEVLGSFDATGKPNYANLKSALVAKGATVEGTTTDGKEGFPMEVTLNGKSYEITANGEITEQAAKISVDESTLTITGVGGTAITAGEVEENTELVINFTASVEGGNVTVSPSLPHTTTTAEMSAKKVVFTLSANVDGETVTREYIVNLKNIYVSNEMTTEQLQTGAATYFGYDVVNYKDFLDTAYKNIEWQLFYAGKINDSDTEDHIYLIAKDYVPYSLLPAKNSAYPLPKGDTDYKTGFSNYNNGNPEDGVIPQYSSGSGAIGTIGQNLNSKFYKYLSDNSTTSSYNNIKAVAYMLDSDIWGNFKGTNADYAIGGPSVELLFKAYNKYKNLIGSSTYVAGDCNANGYKVSKDGGSNYNTFLVSGSISADTNSINSPYIVTDSTKTYGYWLASSSASLNYNVMCVSYDGFVGANDFSNASGGFRPLVCLKSNFQLEKTQKNGKDVFQIVEKSE